MKLILNLVRTNPTSIEEIIMEDVACFYVSDNAIQVDFNNSPREIIELRSNDGEQIREWAGFSVFGTRIGMKVDMSL